MCRFLCLLSVSVFSVFSAAAVSAQTNPAQTKKDVPPVLDRYLQTNDGAYKWELAEPIKTPVPNGKLFLLELTSQKWHGYTWKHYLLVAVPAKAEYKDHALMYVTLGRIGQKPNKLTDFLMAAMLANQASMPIAVLYQVPNQPLDIRKTAKNDGDWCEDDLIAESLLKAVETKDPTWAILLPMTKSVIKAMNAVQEFLKKEHSLDVKKFIVGGASKRGWTTWLVGASQDPRVAGLVPIIYNNLNLPAQMAYQIESWNDFSPRIREYTSRQLFRKGEKPSGFQAEIMQIIDPYTYRNRITVPKLLVHGANDPYWTTDATKWYWKDIQEPKFLLTIPNVGHQDIDRPDNLQKVIPTVGFFCQYVAMHGEWPSSDWNVQVKKKEYLISVETEIPGAKRILWTAAAADNHFEQAKWQSKDCGDAEKISVPKPATGRIAFFVELQAEQLGTRFSITTEVWRY